ncbi:MAG: hypothetical protein AAGN82_27990 [Myxococcota bacterium]
MSIEVREVTDERAGMRDFMNVVDTVFDGDPNYVRPLDMEIADRFDRRKNPFFDHGEAAAWVAYRDGRPVGRISASIDRAYDEHYDDGAGFFGHFDTVDDPAVSEPLLSAASDWLQARGVRLMRGPYPLHLDAEGGCLVDGFDEPPMIMSAHHRRWQSSLIEAYGLRKCRDLFAWTYDVGQVPIRAQRAHDDFLALPEVSVRQGDTKRYADDIRLIQEVYNDAWSDNWGFVPMTERELQKMGDDLRLIFMPQLSQLVFIEGEIAAVALALPNLNELIADTGGKLTPTGALKLLWRLRGRGARSGRLVILGIRKKFRNVRRYAGLSAYLYVAMNRAGHLLGMRKGELSWTLEDNAKINVGIRMMGGRVYKTYRVYEKPL